MRLHVRDSPLDATPYSPRVEEPSRFGLRRAVLYAAGNGGAGLLFAFMNGVFPFFLASYNLPNFAIGFLSQERPPLAGLSQIVVGALSDRTRTRLGRRRPFILFGAPLAAAALLALAFNPPVWVMVGLTVAMTTALAIAYGPYTALLADLVPPDQRGRVGGGLALAAMLGQVAILLLASQFWETNRPLVFAVVAIGLLIGFLITSAGISEPTGVPPSVETPPVSGWLANVLSHREVAKYLFATLFFWFGTGSVVPFLTRFGVQELGTDEGTSLLLLIVALASTALFTLPAGWLGDRFGKKRVMLVGLVIMGISLIIGSQVRSVEQAVAILFVTGFANALSTVPLLPLLSDLIPRERAGEFMGIGGAVWELAQPLGAVIGGVTADVTGSLRSPLAASGVVVLIAALLLLRVHAPRVALAERMQQSA